jgi:hypothetical protein
MTRQPLLLKDSGANTIVLPRNTTQKLTTFNNIAYSPTELPTIRNRPPSMATGAVFGGAATHPSFRIFTVSVERQ